MSEEFNDGMTVVDADNGLLRFHPNGPLWRAWLANYHTTSRLTASRKRRTFAQATLVCPSIKSTISKATRSLAAA
jgi:hypothetical protein